jgi:hypothetical protein
MASAIGVYPNFASGAVSVVTTAETVVGTTRAVGSGYAGCVFSLEFMLDFLTGASVTGVTWRIRRDSVTGTAVLTGPVIAAAAATQLPRMAVAATDSITGEVASQIWVLTVVQTAATGNGSATNVFSRVTVV